MSGHMMRGDESLGSVDDLITRFYSIDLKIVDEEGQNPQANHPHYLGLVRSVLLAVQRLRVSDAHSAEEKKLTMSLLAMLSVLPSKAPVGAVPRC